MIMAFSPDDGFWGYILAEKNVFFSLISTKTN
jgi:hypothetical protein